MSTYNSDFAYRSAEDQRKKAMDKIEWHHVLSEGFAYCVVIGVSALTFVLAVLGEAK